MVFGFFFSSTGSSNNNNSNNNNNNNNATQQSQNNDPAQDETQQQASDHLLVTVIAKRPRALVVLLGHMGATVDQMAKYAQLYHDNKCSTVCATAPILSLASNDTTMMGEIAITACRETARLIRMAELAEMGFGRVPVVVHVLGNGGAQLLEEMEKRIHEVIPKSHLKSMMLCGGAATPISSPSTMLSSIGSCRRGPNLQYNMMTMMMKSGGGGGSNRSLMMKSGGSTRSLMTSSVGGSKRNLMDTKSTHTSSVSSAAGAGTATPFKGSTRSLLTSTSLSSDDDDDEAEDTPVPVGNKNNNAFLKEKYQHLQTKMAAPIVTTTTVSSSDFGDVLDQTCIIEYSVGACSQGDSLSPRALNLLPPCLGSTATDTTTTTSPLTTTTTTTTSLPTITAPSSCTSSANILDRRLQQRRRRRKRETLNVKRIDVERAGLGNTLTSPRYNHDDRAYKRDMELFASRLILGSLVFDSGPYIPTMDHELAALNILLSNSSNATTTATSTATRLMAHSTIVASHGWNGMTSFTYLGSEGSNNNNKTNDTAAAATAATLGGRPAQFWNNMQNIQLSKRHAFIYSRGDTVCPRDDLQNLIAIQQENGKQVLQIELLTTRHLEHRSRRADKYCDFIEQVLNSLEGHSMDISESVDDWFDTDDDNHHDDAMIERGHEVVREKESGKIKIAPATTTTTMPVDRKNATDSSATVTAL